MANNAPDLKTDENSAKPARKRNGRWVVIVIFVIVLGIASPYLYRWWRLTQTSQATDNATLQGRIVSISSKISGQIESVEVVDFH